MSLCSELFHELGEFTYTVIWRMKSKIKRWFNGHGLICELFHVGLEQLIWTNLNSPLVLSNKGVFHIHCVVYFIYFLLDDFPVWYDLHFGPLHIRIIWVIMNIFQIVHDLIQIWSKLLRIKIIAIYIFINDMAFIPLDYLSVIVPALVLHKVHIHDNLFDVKQSFL